MTVLSGDDPEYEQVGSEMCPTYKITSELLDKLIYENTGFHLDETNKKNLDKLNYLPEYDAYYISHGDSRYGSNRINVAGGVRDGDLVRLYYYDDYPVSTEDYTEARGWMCLLLKDIGGGSYHFVSNVRCEEPDFIINQPGGR
ncbi:MAG: hypothetical protein IJS90_06430 [Clostridia bacterium]|nr:hypothetical protein [Clostridia bacterium]